MMDAVPLRDDAPPEDWAEQVVRAYTVFGIDPLGRADEFAWFGGKLDPKFLAEKAKKQLRDLEGKFREMRAKIVERIVDIGESDRKPDLVPDVDLPDEPRSSIREKSPEIDVFEPPIAPEAGKVGPVEPSGAKKDTEFERTDPYKDWERDAEGRVIFREENLTWFTKKDNSMTPHLVDSVDADGKPVKVLTKEREAIHRELVNRVFDGVPKSKREHPLSIFMGGGSGAGKSTATETVKDFPKTRQMKHYGKRAAGEAALIDADGFKPELPEWGFPNQMETAGFVHQESSLLADLAREEGYRRRVDMVHDGTGDSGPEEMTPKIEKAKAEGYEVGAMYVTTPTSEAMVRVASRGAATGRQLPPQLVDKIHKDVTDTFNAIMEQFGNKIDLYDADVPRGTKGIPIIVEGKVIDQARLDAFNGKPNVEFLKSLTDAIARAKDPSREYDRTETKTSEDIRKETIKILELALETYLKATKQKG